MNTLIPILLLLTDAASFSAALLLTFLFRAGTGNYGSPIPSALTYPNLALSVFWWFVFGFGGLYGRVVSLARFDEIFRCFKAVLAGVVIIYFATFETRAPISFTRLFLLTYGILLLLFVTVSRMAVREFQIWLRWKGLGMSNAVIVGFNEMGLRLFHQLHRQPVWGYRVMGFLDDHIPNEVPNDVKFLGETSNLPEVITRNRIRWVLIAPTEGLSDRVFQILNRCLDLHVRFMIVADYYQMVVGFIKGVQVHGLPLVEVVSQPVSLAIRTAKRAMDLIGGGIGTTVFLFLVPILAAMLKISSPGPIFQFEGRVGRRGKSFRVWHFRTIDGAGNPSRVGRVLHRFRLDRLPEFVAVLSGRMSLVGPKAESPEYVATYRGIVPLYNRRFNIRPGITGWAQVRWRYGDNVEDVIEKTKYDLYYLDHVSPALDLWIILASVKRLIKGIKG